MRLGFSKSFPFTITGWRDVFAMGLTAGSYSDSEAAERCKMSGLGTLPAPSTEVAERTGETDIFLACDAHETVTRPGRSKFQIAWICCDVLTLVFTFAPKCGYSELSFH